MAEPVLVLALFEKVLQQLFDLVFMVHFSEPWQALTDIHRCLLIFEENFVYGFLRYQPKAKKASEDREKILISFQESSMKCLDWARDAFQQHRGDLQNRTQDEDS